MRDDDPQLVRLVASGWLPVAESFGARLVLPADEASLVRLREHLRALVDGRRAAQDPAQTKAGSRWTARELDRSWLPELVRFDDETRAGYPADSPATSRASLDAHSAADLWEAGRVYGVVGPIDDRLVAVTVIRQIDSCTVETEFTAVSGDVRRQGLGVAVKAFSVMSETRRGVREFRTGGSCANRAIRAANARVGYQETEQWVTVAAPSAP